MSEASKPGSERNAWLNWLLACAVFVPLYLAFTALLWWLLA